jgi:hypothetical protein
MYRAGMTARRVAGVLNGFEDLGFLGRRLA